MDASMDADEDIMEEEEEGAGHLGEDGAGRGYSLERYQEHIAGRADDPPEDEDDPVSYTHLRAHET